MNVFPESREPKFRYLSGEKVINYLIGRCIFNPSCKIESPSWKGDEVILKSYLTFHWVQFDRDEKDCGFRNVYGRIRGFSREGGVHERIELSISRAIPLRLERGINVRLPVCKTSLEYFAPSLDEGEKWFVRSNYLRFSRWIPLYRKEENIGINRLRRTYNSRLKLDDIIPSEEFIIREAVNLSSQS